MCAWMECAVLCFYGIHALVHCAMYIQIVHVYYFQGEPGNTGPVGPPGPRGPVGERGLNGYDGVHGTPGAKVHVPSWLLQFEFSCVGFNECSFWCFLAGRRWPSWTSRISRAAGKFAI